MNTNATTVNIAGGASTAINIGGANSVCTINSKSIVTPAYILILHILKQLQILAQVIKVALLLRVCRFKVHRLN